MTLEIVVWVLLGLVAVVAGAAQAIAAAVRDLRPAVETPRMRFLSTWGEPVAALARALAAAVAVVAISLAGGEVWLAALGATATILLLLGLQRVAGDWARKSLNRLASPLLGEAAVFLPLVEPRAESSEPEETRDEAVEQMVEASEKAGWIESDEHEMISGVLQLDRTLTREIMVPHIDVIALSVETPLHDALDVVIAGAHSRVPVYEESIDHVVGLLYAKDLLRALRDGKTDVSLRDLMRPVHFVPESKRLD